MNGEKVRLHEFILQHFNLGELRDLCLYLNVDSDDLAGDTRPDKTRELVRYLARRRRLPDLHLLLKQLREQPYLSAFPAAATVEIAVSATSELERNPRQIFISHATADAAFGHRLADDLRNASYTIWIAPESIPPGQWVRAINQGLEQSGTMVLVLSPAAVESPWVEMETNVAIELERSGEMRFIPLLWQIGRFPTLWRAYQYVPFDSEYETGLATLLARLDGRTITSPPTHQHIEVISPAPLLPRTPASFPNRRTHEKTGIELIRIPAGPFLYGSSDSDKMAFDNEKPQRTIDLPEYWIGRTPVTNAQYYLSVQATGYRTTAEEEGKGRGWINGRWDWIVGADWRHPSGPESSLASKHEHPVVQVNWHDAQAFCDWTGLILPSEEEWEKAARGTVGPVWPWGNEPPTDIHCNFSRNVDDTTPVGNYSPRGDSAYGCVDMAGNVWEWTGSWNLEGSTSVLRGGSWNSVDRAIRVAFRKYYNPDIRYNYVGFRVVEPFLDPHAGLEGLV